MMTCKYCSCSCQKAGKQKNGVQKWYCKSCNKYQQQEYSSSAYSTETNNRIVNFLKEGCGIRSISRLLEISTNTVMARIISISKTIVRPIPIFGKEYEMDEMCTFIGKKSRLRWIVYALRKDTREVIDFRIGPRTNSTLSAVVATLQLANASKIYTDKLVNYKALVDSSVHSTIPRGTNHIERRNLTLRTHLKRLGRRTICYSKRAIMLTACLKIYFWG